MPPVCGLNAPVVVLYVSDVQFAVPPMLAVAVAAVVPGAIATVGAVV